MEIKTFTVRTSHGRFRGGGGGSARSNRICHFWKEGKCNRNPCRFVHGDSPAPNVYHRSLKQSQSQSQVKDRLRKSLEYVLSANVKNPNIGHKELPRKCPSYCLNNLSVLKTGSGVFEDEGGQKRSKHDTEDFPRKCRNPKNLLAGLGPEDKRIEENSGYETKVMDVKKITVQQKFPEHSPKDAAVVLTTEDPVPEVKIPQKNQQKVCEQWMLGSCVEGEGCRFLHSWSHGDGFSMLAKLSRHSEAVSGIALPSGSDKLYSGSTDGTVHVWDCHTGQSVGQMNLGDKIGSLISEGPWIFVGMPNVVKAWNIQTAAEFSINGPVGQVHAMAVGCNMLFAGAQNGVILAWKGSSENSNPFQLAASLEGHMSVVTCLAVGAKGLCSGSMDGTIKVWDLDSLQCIRTLNGHTDAVMSLISWNHQYLLSCSLDRTIKVWFAADGSDFEVTYTHEEEHGALALCGVNDAEGRPVLLCSCNDNSVRLYELPSFSERGRIFSKQEVRTMQIGPGGLFFTGDGTGALNVWKWTEQRAAL